MLDRNIFMETLRDVSEIIRTSAEPMSKEEILSYFKDMELTKEQEEMVFTYLLTPHEEEVPIEPEAEEPVEEVENNEIPESKVFQMYLEDIGALKAYSEDTVRMAYVKLLSGDEKSIEVISAAWLRRIVDMAKKYFNSAVNTEDVIQEGNMALFIRLKELCGSRAAVDVEADLDEKVTEAMKSYISEVTGEEDCEETIAGKANLIKEAIRYLEEQNGMTPDKKAIAEFTHLDEEELSDIMDIMEKAEKKKGRQ